MRFLFFILLQNCVNSELANSKRMSSSIEESTKKPFKVFLSYNDNPKDSYYVNEFLTHAYFLRKTDTFSFFLKSSTNFKSTNQNNLTFLSKEPSDNEINEYDYILPFLSSDYMTSTVDQSAIQKILSDDHEGKPMLIPIRLRSVTINKESPLFKKQGLPIKNAEPIFIADYPTNEQDPIYTSIISALKKVAESEPKISIPKNLSKDSVPLFVSSPIKTSPETQRISTEQNKPKIHFLYADTGKNKVLYSDIKNQLQQYQTWSFHANALAGSNIKEENAKYLTASKVVFLVDVNFLADNGIITISEGVLANPNNKISIIIIGPCMFEYAKFYSKIKNENIKFHIFYKDNKNLSNEEKSFEIAKIITKDMNPID